MGWFVIFPHGTGPDVRPVAERKLLQQLLALMQAHASLVGCASTDVALRAACGADDQLLAQAQASLDSLCKLLSSFAQSGAQLVVTVATCHGSKLSMHDHHACVMVHRLWLHHLAHLGIRLPGWWCGDVHV